MRCNPDQTRRQGFSLPELLVVIAILAVLMSLTAAAVFKYINQGPEAVCSSELAALSTARAAFLQEFNVSHMPSRMTIRENGSYVMTNPVERASVAFLQTMFGRRFNPNTARDWNNDNDTTDVITLEGQNCLVFFLGGIPSRASNGANACLGFSTDPVNPVNVDGNGHAVGTRRGPFFDFKSTRLSRDLTSGHANMFVYFDPFLRNRPYAYFSAGRNDNAYTDGDCSALGVNPYRVSNTRYVNSSGFQIISAGQDGQFGPGGVWTTLGAGPGVDDRANFARGRLGIGPTS